MGLDPFGTEKCSPLTTCSTFKSIAGATVGTTIGVDSAGETGARVKTPAGTAWFGRTTGEIDNDSAVGEDGDMGDSMKEDASACGSA